MIKWFNDKCCKFSKALGLCGAPSKNFFALNLCDCSKNLIYIAEEEEENEEEEDATEEEEDEEEEEERRAANLKWCLKKGWVSKLKYKKEIRKYKTRFLYICLNEATSKKLISSILTLKMSFLEQNQYF